MSDNPGLTKASVTLHRAMSQLLEKGYNVYENVEPQGQIDLIIESRTNKKLLRVDVKTINYINAHAKTRISGATLRPNQRDYPENGILFLVVDDDDCMWVQGYISQNTPREKRPCTLFCRKPSNWRVRDHTYSGKYSSILL